jgi:non-ribosomal peptide synthetase component E (peptide arylation enzyme)
MPGAQDEDGNPSVRCRSHEEVVPVNIATQELVREYLDSGVWQGKSLLEIVSGHAERTPDKLAVACGPDRLSYSRFVAAVQATAQFLLDAGVAPGEVVALQSANHVAIPVLHFACESVGAVFLPLPTNFRQREMRHLLNVAEATVVILPSTDPTSEQQKVLAEVRDDVPSVRVVAGIAGDGEYSLVSALAGQGERLLRYGDPNVASQCMITSGSTGLSRISLYTANNLWLFATTYAHFTRMTAADVALGIAPASQGATGYVFPVLSPLVAGASTVMLEHWDPLDALRLIEEEGITLTMAIPTQILKMLQHESVDDYDYSSLRVFSKAGAAMAPEQCEEVERVFGCRMQTPFGATDGGLVVQTDYDDPPAKRFSTLGRPFAGNRLRIVDPEGAELGPDAPGEAQWRTPTKSLGYLNDPERDELSFTSDGYYRSGDLGVVDEAGYLRIVGRLKEMIMRGGQNISPAEIENVLGRHEKIAEVAVIGLPDPLFGERACACLVLTDTDEFDMAELTRFLTEQALERFKFPESIEIFASFPMTHASKISKIELAAEVERRRAERATAQ